MNSPSLLLALALSLCTLTAQAQAGDASVEEDAGALSDGGPEEEPDDAGAASDAGSSSRDAGTIHLPDASVGEGGADRDQQERDDATGRVPETCIRSIECPSGFTCVDGRCRYVGVRQAEGGFGCFGMATASAGALPPFALFAFALRWLRRRR